MVSEVEIINEIGLYGSAGWYDGNGSCRIIRTRAVENMAKIIQKHYNRGEQIAQPDDGLIETLKKIAADGEKGDSSLRSTWTAASNVISAHISQAKTSENERQAVYKTLKQNLESEFLSNLK